MRLTVMRPSLRACRGGARRAPSCRSILRRWEGRKPRPLSGENACCRSRRARVELHGFEYKRYSTLSHYATFTARTGKVQGKTMVRV